MAVMSTAWYGSAVKSAGGENVQRVERAVTQWRSVMGVTAVRRPARGHQQPRALQRAARGRERLSVDMVLYDPRPSEQKRHELKFSVDPCPLPDRCCGTCAIPWEGYTTDQVRARRGYRIL